MSYTYDLSTSIGKVRLEIGDTVSANALLTDEEITDLIAAEGGTAVLLWSARCCEVIARKFARDFNWQGDGTRVDKGERAKTYLEMAKAMRAKEAATAGGGINVVHTIHADGWNRNREINESSVGAAGAFLPLRLGDRD